MIAAFLALFEWAAAGLGAIAFVSVVQTDSLASAYVAVVAGGLAALSRHIALRRAASVYSDAALRPLLGRRPARSVNDNGGAW